MQRIFLPPDQFSDGKARITGGDHLHLARVLRAKPGEKLILLNGLGQAFSAILERIEKSESSAAIENEVTLAAEPAVHICIAQALVKGDKFEQVIQHGIEAGAGSFIPIRADRCVVDIPDAKVDDRVARWQQIAKSATEQSGRGFVPKVFCPMNMSILLANRTAGEPIFLLHPHPPSVNLKSILSDIPIPSRVLLVIGPEGGWDDREVRIALNAGASIVSLGPRILRTETAALIAISQIQYQWES